MSSPSPAPLEPPTDDLDAFLRWNSGHLIENRIRCAYAEWLVYRALGLDLGEYRHEGAVVEVSHGAISIEVKSAAYVQSWQQSATSSISFAIEPRNTMAYVFCLLAEPDPERVNPQDLSQWLFWVVPTRMLHAERRSIGLQPLIRAHGEGLPYGELRAAVERLGVLT